MSSSSSTPSTNTSSVSETPNNTTISGIGESITKQTTHSSPPLETSPNKKTITPLSPQQEQPLSHLNAQNPTPSTDGTNPGKIIDKIGNSVHSGYSSAGELNGGEELCNEEQDEEEDDHGWLAGAATKLKG